MRALIVSDIHANLAAFEAVLSDSEKDRDLVICLGDLVGYGPDPNECVELALSVCDKILAGNHDLAACERMDISDFSNHARRAMIWTRSRISPSTKKTLELLPPLAQYQDFLISHGSPEAPVWGYILSAEDAEIAFTTRAFNLCLFGHTHIPSAFSQEEGFQPAPVQVAYGEPDSRIAIAGARRLINPGSVGFPRDGADAHASGNEGHAAARYGILDMERGIWEFRRVEYDMRETSRRMRREGLW